MKKINYFSTIGDNDEYKDYLPTDYIIPPKKWLGEQGKNYYHNKCPAWKEWGKNTWIVYQQFDIEFKYVSAEKRVTSGSVNQRVFDNYFSSLKKLAHLKLPLPLQLHMHLYLDL